MPATARGFRSPSRTRKSGVPGPRRLHRTREMRRGWRPSYRRNMAFRSAAPRRLGAIGRSLSSRFDTQMAAGARPALFASVGSRSSSSDHDHGAIVGWRHAFGEFLQVRENRLNHFFRTGLARMSQHRFQPDPPIFLSPAVGQFGDAVADEDEQF